MSDWFFFSLVAIVTVLAVAASLRPDRWWRLLLRQRLMIARQRRKVLRGKK